MPDCTLLLDIPAEKSADRTLGRGGSRDRIEMLDLDFKQRVRQAYLDRQRAQPVRIRRLDGQGSIATVQKEILGILTDLDARGWGDE